MTGFSRGPGHQLREHRHGPRGHRRSGPAGSPGWLGASGRRAGRGPPPRGSRPRVRRGPARGIRAAPSRAGPARSGGTRLPPRPPSAASAGMIRGIGRALTAGRPRHRRGAAPVWPAASVAGAAGAARRRVPAGTKGCGRAAGTTTAAAGQKGGSSTEPPVNEGPPTTTYPRQLHHPIAEKNPRISWVPRAPFTSPGLRRETARVASASSRNPASGCSRDASRRPAPRCGSPAPDRRAVGLLARWPPRG